MTTHQCILYLEVPKVRTDKISITPNLKSHELFHTSSPVNTQSYRVSTTQQNEIVIHFIFCKIQLIATKTPLIQTGNELWFELTEQQLKRVAKSAINRHSLEGFESSNWKTPLSLNNFNSTK